MPGHENWVFGALAIGGGHPDVSTLVLSVSSAMAVALSPGKVNLSFAVEARLIFIEF